MAKNLITTHIIESIISLNKQSKEKTREEVKSIFADAGSIDFDTPETRRSLTSLAEVMRVIFQTAGNTSIDFNKLINISSTKQMFAELGAIAGEQFWDAWAVVANNKDNMQRLLKTTKLQLTNTEYYKTGRRNYAMQALGNSNDPEALNEIFSEFEFVARDFVGKTTDEIYDIVDAHMDAIEQALSQFSSQKTVKNYTTAADAIALFIEDIRGLQTIPSMKALTQNKGRYNLSQIERMTSKYSFPTSVRDDTAIDPTAKNNEFYENIKTQFNAASSDEFNTVAQRIKELEVQIFASIKSFEDVNVALEQFRTTGGKLKSTYIDNIKTTLDDSKSGKKIMIASAYDKYNEAMSNVNASWVEKNQAMLNFITAFENASKKMQASENYQFLYDALKSSKDSIRQNLLSVMHMANAELNPAGSDSTGYADPAELKAVQNALEAERKKSARLEELLRKLDEYAKNESTSEATEENLNAREQIMQQLEAEKLVTEEIRKNYEEGNRQIKIRADLLRAAETHCDDITDVTGSGIRINAVDSAEEYLEHYIKPFEAVIDKMRASGLFSEEELEESFYQILRDMEDETKNIGFRGAFNDLDEQVVDLNEINDINELKKILQKRQDIVEKYGEDALEEYDGGAYEEAMLFNDAIEERISFLQQANNIDDDDDIRRENGALEEKLELLREIAEEYGSDITQKQRDRYDELNQKEEDRQSELGDKIYDADEALMNFEETYDRIILKLANGKKVEILPDDKGLRSLYKYATESFGDDFNGIEIEDVIFERAQKEVASNQNKIESYEELCEVVKRYNQLVVKGSDRSSEERKEFKALNERINATKGERTPDQMVNDTIAWDLMTRPIGMVSIENLAHYLGIEIPKAAQTAERAVDSLNSELHETQQSLLPSADNFERTQQPSDAQKAEVLKLGEEYRVIMSLLEKDDEEVSEIAGALRERATAIMNVMHAVKGSDSTPAESYQMYFGGSAETANSLANWQQRDRLHIHSFNSDKIDNTARQAVIDLIYKEIEAQKQLAEARKAAREAERQQDIDNFVSKYENATAEEKQLVNDLTGLWRESRRLNDLEDDESVRAYDQVIAERHETSERLKTANRELYEAFYDVNYKDVAKYIKPIDNINASETHTTTAPSGELISADTDSTTPETRDMDALLKKVGEVTKTVGEKTKALQDEKTEVDKVVDAEVESLVKLESKITTIKGIFEGIVNNIRNGSDDIGAGLNNVNINVNYPEEDDSILSNIAADITEIKRTLQGDLVITRKENDTKKPNQPKDISKMFEVKMANAHKLLNNLEAQLRTKGVSDSRLNQIDNLRNDLNSVTDSNDLALWRQKLQGLKLDIGDDKIVDTLIDEENVAIYEKIVSLTKERRDLELQIANNKGDRATNAQQIDEINEQIKAQRELLFYIDETYEARLGDTLGSHSRKIERGVINSAKKEQDAQDRKESDATLFASNKEVQFSTLSLWYEKLEASGKLTDEIKNKWMDLWDALDKVESADALKLWKNELTQVKNDIQEIIVANNLIEQEGKTSFQSLINITKLYNKMSVKAQKSTTPELKTFYTNEANAALVEQQRLLKGITLSEEQQVEFDELELQRKREINAIVAQQKDEDNNAALKVLLGLYKEYGELDAKWNYSNGKNDAAEQERQMLDVYKKIQEQKASMGISADDTRYDKEITKAWEQGFKDIENVKRSARAKALDKSDAQRIKEEVQKVEKYVKELGTLEADLQFTSGDKETAEIKRQIEQKQRYIDLKKEELKLDEKDLLIQQTTAYQNKYNSSARKDSRAQDKADDAATTKKNNEAYERLVQLRRTQYDLEKKLSGEKEGSKLAGTYQSQLLSIKQLIANQKTLVHYNEKYEKQLADMAEAHKRNKEQWESGKIDDARAEALAAEKKEVKELADAYSELGKLIAARNYATTPEAKNAIQETINKRVADIRGNSRNTAANRGDFISALRSSQEVAEDSLRQRRAEQDGKKRIQDEANALKSLIDLEKEHGILEAKREFASTDAEKSELDRQITKKKEEIALKKNGMQVDEEELRIARELAKQKQHNTLALQSSRAQGRADKTAKEQENNKAYERLIKLKELQYSIEKKLIAAEAGSQKEFTYKDQLAEVEALVEAQKQLLYYTDAVYEQKLKDKEDTQRRDIEELVSGMADQENAKAKKEADDIIKEKTKNATSLAKYIGELEAKLDFAESDKEINELIRQIDELTQKLLALKQELNLNGTDVDAAIQNAYTDKYNSLAISDSRVQGRKEERDALNTEKETIKELNDLYKKLGQAEAKRDMTSRNIADAVIADDDYQSILKEIEAKRDLIEINDKLENQFTDSWMTGVESETKKPIGNLTKAAEALGMLRAEIEKTPNGDYLDFLKRRFVLESKLLEVESKRLGISPDEKESNRLKAEDVYNSEMFKWQGELAKKRDKERNDEQAKLFKQQIKQSKELAKVNQATSAINKADNTLNLVPSIGGWSGEHVARLNEYSDKLRALKDQYTEIKYSDGVVTEAQQEELINQTANVNKLTGEINELIANYNRLSGDNATVIGADTLGSSATIGDYKKQLTDLVMAHTNGKASITGFDAATKELTYTVQTGKYEFTEYTVALRQADGQIVKLEGNTKRLETPMEKLKRKMSEILTYFGGSSLIYEFFGQFRQGVQYVRDIDSALTELKKVTDETEESYDRFLETAAKTADKVGSTITNIVSSTADWARLGYSMEDAAQLAESTSVLLNVSEFSSIEDATSALTSTMQAFGYVAEDSMHVVDVLNQIGNNFAVSSDGLATALQDSASALMAANNSYEEAVSLIAAANRVVQDPNSVGAALRTISLRLRGTGVKELEDAGEDTTGVITSKSKLRGKIKTLSGVDILTDTGAYKSTYEILLEISRVWEDMSDIDQAALLEILAGIFYQNVWKHAFRTHLNPVVPKALLLQCG